MAGHFLLSPASRDLSVEKIEKMTDKAVHSYFARMRWGDAGTQVCPECGSIEKHYWIASRKQWRCRSVACGRMFSVTSGTVFSDHKLPLKKILKAMAIFINNVKGISALALTRDLGVAYQTAFVLLHKLREALTKKLDRTPLKGVIHMDGAHVSGRIRKPRVKKPATKTQARDRIPKEAFPRHHNRRIVMVLRDIYPEPGRGARRTITYIAFSEDQRTIMHLAQEYIAPGSEVMTDELGGYTKLSKIRRHRAVNHSNEFSTDEGVSNNQAESFFSRVRRFIIGQVHRVTPHYMGDYMNEMAWREDTRRDRPTEKLDWLVKSTMGSWSEKWRYYWRGQDRPVKVKPDGFLMNAEELLLTPAELKKLMESLREPSDAVAADPPKTNGQSGKD